MDSGYVLEVEPIGCADGLDLDGERNIIQRQLTGVLRKLGRWQYHLLR